jgi:hypothetical protein
MLKVCFASEDRQFAFLYINLRQELRRVWRYQGGNQNSYIEEQTTSSPIERVQKDKQRSTKQYT